MAKRKVKDIIVNKDWCKGCGICIRFCPSKILGMEKGQKCYVIDKEKCIGCQLCELRCPDFAIEVIFEDEGKE